MPQLTKPTQRNLCKVTRLSQPADCDKASVPKSEETASPPPSLRSQLLPLVSFLLLFAFHLDCPRGPNRLTLDTIAEPRFRFSDRATAQNPPQPSSLRDTLRIIYSHSTPFASIFSLHRLQLHPSPHYRSNKDRFSCCEQYYNHRLTSHANPTLLGFQTKPPGLLSSNFDVGAFCIPLTKQQPNSVIRKHCKIPLSRRGRRGSWWLIKQ